MSRYAKHVSAKVTPQTEPVPGKPMSKNNAGGYTFTVDKWTQLERFLILGAVGGTYYVGERKLAQENAAVVMECAKEDASRTVKTITDISVGGRAPKNDPAVFALALVAGMGGEAATFAFAALPKVCRIGTHLFQFVSAVQEFRGWGPALKKAVARWYTTKKPEDVAYQVTKYQQREGWSHRDVLRLAKPKGVSGEMGAVLRFAVGKNPAEMSGIDSHHPAILRLEGHELVKSLKDQPKQAAKVIRDYKLVRESVPTELLNSPDVWDALLEDMPVTAMIRNLGKMTSIELAKPLSAATKKIVDTITNVDVLKKGRVHPLNLLVALRTYANGKGDKGSLAWSPVQQIVQALDDAFYLAFQAVEPTGKRWMLGLDVSASMGAQIAGTPLSCCEAATAMALVTSRTEPQSFIGRFNTGFEDVPLTGRSTLKSAMQYTQNINGGGTDCSLPMLEAIKRKLEVDTFVVYTDSETYYGGIHPFQALRKYREHSGIPAKLIVVGMTATRFTIADPSDAGMLDVVGFDTAVPAVMADFAKG